MLLEIAKSCGFVIMNKFLLLFAGIVLSASASALDIKNHVGDYAEVVGVLSLVNNYQCSGNERGTVVIVNHNGGHRVYTAMHVLVDSYEKKIESKSGYCLFFKSGYYKGDDLNWQCDGGRDICYADIREEDIFLDRDIVFTRLGRFEGNYGVDDELSVAGIGGAEKYVEFSGKVYKSGKYLYVGFGDDCNVDKKLIPGTSGGGFFDGDKLIGIIVIINALVSDIREDLNFVKIERGKEHDNPFIDFLSRSGSLLETKNDLCADKFALDEFDRAINGDPVAQYDLGIAYYNGEVVEQDYKEAYKWFRTVESTNHWSEWARENSGYMLGEMFYHGHGVKQDYSEAMKWYRKYAEKGDVTSQSKLGYMYYNGEGVAQDYMEAFKWFILAAEELNIDAQIYLGYMYDKGYGVTEDDSEAIKWYKLAAEQGVADAQYNLGLMYYNGEGVAQDYMEAFNLFSLAADEAYSDAQNYLGHMYEEGQGVEEDHDKAIKWYRLAAEQGNILAYYNLGIFYYRLKNYDEAFNWLRLAAEQGDADAQFGLGWMFNNGEGVEKDYIKGDEWYIKSAAQGNVFAQYNLCYNNLYGKFVVYRTAYKYCTAALANEELNDAGFTDDEIEKLKRWRDLSSELME